MLSFFTQLKLGLPMLLSKQKPMSWPREGEECLVGREVYGLRYNTERR